MTGRSDSDPAAQTLAGSVVSYAYHWKPAASRKALYVGDSAGKRHLEFSGIPAASYEGGQLTPDQVLVVGPGGGQPLAKSAAAVAEFVKAGGNLLALGLDQQEANAFLPFKVGMKKAEHIAAFFAPAGKKTLFAGVSPADVHNRAPASCPWSLRGPRRSATACWRRPPTPTSCSASSRRTSWADRKRL